MMPNLGGVPDSLHTGVNKGYDSNNCRFFPDSFVKCLNKSLSRKGEETRNGCRPCVR